MTQAMSESVFPLSNLAFCRCHRSATKMSINSGHDYRTYVCCDPLKIRWKHYLAADHLDQAICDFILTQCCFEEYAEVVTAQLNEGYDQAAKEAEIRAQEIKRLEKDSDKTYQLLLDKSNTPEYEAYLRAKLSEQLKRKKELSHIDAYPAGRVRQAITIEDVRFVHHMLEDLRAIWPQQTSSLKNEFLSLIIDRIDLFHLDRYDILPRAVICWRSGLAQTIELLLPRRGETNQAPWVEEEDELICNHYASGPDILHPLLPARPWSAILRRADELDLPDYPSKAAKKQQLWTPDEDAVVDQWLAGQLTSDELLKHIHRSYRAIAARTHERGGHPGQRPATWRWVQEDDSGEKQEFDAGCGSRNSGSCWGCRSHRASLHRWGRAARCASPSPDTPHRLARGGTME